MPGTTSAAVIKADFLKDIITKKESIKEINEDFAFELLFHMKGGQSIKVLFLDLVFSDNKNIASKSWESFKNTSL